jgi:putative tryptophan/tyrosine transport system substrate-binding protein
MRRREFIMLLGGAAAWPMPTRAQQPIGRTGNMPRVGILMPGPTTHSAITLDPFYLGLKELGYIVGQNLAVELRNGDWKPDRFSALAAELIAMKIDILVAWSTPTARAAKQATNSIPIVAGTMADPVADELVATLARPGGNVTGTTFLGPELVAKRLQLLRDVGLSMSSSVIANSIACRHFAMMPLLVRSDTNGESTNESPVPCRLVSWNRAASRVT